MNFLCLLIALVFWLASFLYIRQVTTIEHKWYQWIIGIGLIICGFPFFYGTFFG